MEIKLRGESKFIFHSYYRQWSIKGQDKQTKYIKAQKDRLDRAIQSIETANKEKVEIITAGDMNVDALTWKDKRKDKTNHQNSLSCLAEMINDRLMDKGFYLINREETFNTLNNDIYKPTQVDHYYTNTPQKVLATNTIHNTTSDHCAVSVVRTAKPQNEMPNYYLTRNY